MRRRARPSSRASTAPRQKTPRPARRDESSARKAAIRRSAKRTRSAVRRIAGNRERGTAARPRSPIITRSKDLIAVHPMRRLFAAAFLLLACAAAAAQPLQKLHSLEGVTEYKLDNGLRV